MIASQIEVLLTQFLYLILRMTGTYLAMITEKLENILFIWK